MTSDPNARRSGFEGRRVVILGGGYGGTYAAIELQKAAKRGEIFLELVSRDNFFLYYPMLAEVVSGSIEPPHIVNPIRRMIPNMNFHNAEIQGIDVESRHVIIQYPGHTSFSHIPYDHLIISVGNSTDLSALPGMAEHAFPFKTLGDSLFLRNHLIGILERAEVEGDAEQKREMLTFVVAGAGYTGVEVASEINEFMREASKSYAHVDTDEVNVILLQGRERILLELPEDLAEFSHRILERRGIEIRTNCRISGATAQSAILGDGTSIRTRTLVAAVGSAPNRILDSLPCSRDSRGRLIVDENLAVPGYPGIWAVGDCAAVTDINTGEPAPPTAQFALREGKAVAKNVRALLGNKPLKPFSYKSMGVFVPLGMFTAAAQVMNLKLSGFPAWWLYRTYYLLQLHRLERKLRVVTDWTLSLLFRRDIVRIDINKSDSVFRAHYEPGQIVYRQGDLARSFYIILSGDVQVYRQHNGQEQELARLGTGEYFGEMALLTSVAHSASVRAITPIDLLIMNGTDFADFATASTRFGDMIAGVMRQRADANAESETRLKL
jgi:NADH dehydrogenase